jgi:hypothetical protein
MNKVFTELYFVTIIWLFKEHILIRFCSSVLGKGILVRYSVIVCSYCQNGFVNFDIYENFLQYHKEVVRLMSGEFRQKIGDKYISFAQKWMNYVLTKCESGRGTRPR